MFELKPDFEQVLERYEAWWRCAILDRPLVSIAYPKPAGARRPLPESNHPTLRARWLDAAYVAAREDATLTNKVHAADSLPYTIPNLGPEVFSAFYGCELEFGEHTSWSSPVLAGWDDETVDRLRFDPGNFYLEKIDELTEALLERGRGRFLVGYTDLHAGGDALAAFRDPQELLIDTLEHPGAIKRLGDRITTDFLELYDRYHAKLSAAGMPSIGWAPVTGKGRVHVPSNDFSCMISDVLFEDLFLPGIVRECRHMDRCIYHLDGPQALRYLDRLLEIPEIHAMQWVPGAGREEWHRWIEVYQRIQAAGKALQILSVPAAELDDLFEVLAPEGVLISAVSGISNPEEAEAALRAVSQWTRRRG